MTLYQTSQQRNRKTDQQSIMQTQDSDLKTIRTIFQSLISVLGTIRQTIHVNVVVFGRSPGRENRNTIRTRTFERDLSVRIGSSPIRHGISGIIGKVSAISRFDSTSPIVPTDTA